MLKILCLGSYSNGWILCSHLRKSAAKAAFITNVFLSLKCIVKSIQTFQYKSKIILSQYVHLRSILFHHFSTSVQFCFMNEVLLFFYFPPTTHTGILTVSMCGLVPTECYCKLDLIIMHLKKKLLIKIKFLKQPRKGNKLPPKIKTHYRCMYLS